MYLCSLALDGLVPLITHFRVDLIRFPLLWSFFIAEIFLFRILMPNKIHNHHRRLILHELVVHAMIPSRNTVFPIIHPPPTTIPSLSHLPSWLSMARQPMQWLRLTLHYYMYTFIKKWITIVYYEHIIIIHPSSWTDGADVISDIYLYSRWLWWTLDSSIYKTSIPEGCDTRTMFRMQELVIVYIYNIIRSNLDTKRLINGLFYPMLDRHLIADHLGWFKESTQDSSGWQVAYYWGIVESERGEGPKG